MAVGSWWLGCGEISTVVRVFQWRVRGVRLSQITRRTTHGGPLPPWVPAFAGMTIEPAGMTETKEGGKSVV